MMRASLSLLLVLVGLFAAGPAFAFPWMVRHGQTVCSTCHADPSGGELLNLYGREQGQSLLAMRYRAESLEELSEEAPRIGPLWNLLKTPSWLLVGGAYRHAAIYKAGPVNKFVAPPLQVDAFGQLSVGKLKFAGSVGASRVPPGSPHARGAHVTANQGSGWNVLSRWHWLGLYLRDGKYSLRAGRLNVPFGLRLPEHTAWVRESTRSDYESDQQHGVALAHVWGNVRAEVMGILGNYQINPDAFRERGYSGYLEGLLGPMATLGVSSKVTRAEKDLLTLEETTTVRQAHGLFARWAPMCCGGTAPFVVLAEADLLLRSRHDWGYVSFLQLDIEPVRGLHLMFTGEALDDGLMLRQPNGELSATAKAPGAGLPKLGGWTGVAWWFYPQLEVRVDGIARYGDPYTVIGQLHLYL
jgi:hypothetical protein